MSLIGLMDSLSSGQQIMIVLILSFLLWVLYLTVRMISNYKQMPNIPGTWQAFPTLFKVPWFAPYVFWGSFEETDQLMREMGDPETRTTRITMSKNNVLNVCDKDMLKEILVAKNHLFHKPPHLYELFNTFGINILSNLDSGEEWKKHHRVASNAFGTKNLEHMTSVAVNSVDLIRSYKWDKQIDSAIKNGEKGILLDANSDFSDITLDVLGKSGFGLDFSIFDDSNPEGKIFRRSLETMFTNGVLLAHLFKSLVPFLAFALPFANKWFGVDKAVDNVSKKLDDIISKRRKELELENGDISDNSNNEEKRDLLSLMVEANINAEAKDKLTDMEIKSDAYIFSLAGHETTSTSLQWTLYELARNPKIQNKVREDIDNYYGKGLNAKKPYYDDFSNLPYVTAVMLESLRLHPPVTGAFRTAKKDTTIGKFHVPKDTFISINIYTANRYEKNYEKPLEFIPERFPMDSESQTKKLHDFTLTSFSMGSRKCIGYRFAILEKFSILCRMMQFYEFELLNNENDENDRVQPLPGVTVRPKNLKLLMKPRSDL